MSPGSCSSTSRIRVDGIPDFIPSPLAQECRTQVMDAVSELLLRTGLESVSLSVATVDSRGKVPDGAGSGGGRSPNNVGMPTPGDDLTIEQRADQYHARAPLFDFDFLVISDDVKESILSAVDLIKVEDVVFDQWNLRSIEPYPRAALNFHGPSGTGKTLAAHAVASYLDRPILPVSYAHIESKYVGDSSKNIEAVFHAAHRDEAVLFIDEADSLLSKRLTDVTQGAEQAINSMRSQLLISMERYEGVVVFSTNLIENYDYAFETRMRHVAFPMPDMDCRRRIWEKHLPPQLPLAKDVVPARLAEIDGLCGRDIKNAVIDAALRAARRPAPCLTHEDLHKAVQRVQSTRLPSSRRRLEKPTGMVEVGE